MSTSAISAASARLAVARRIDHHAGEPRRQRQLAQPPALLGDAAVAHRSRRGSASSAFASASAGRGGGSRNASVAGSATPQCARSSTKPERSAARISGVLDGVERRGLRLVPQPVADAGLGAPGAAAALVGGGARHPHGLEPRQADVRLVARHAREPAVDHDAHALDGERGLGDRGREHDLAAAGRRRRDRAVLHVGIERAIERDDVDRRIGRRARAAASRCGGFRRARQEHQHRARLGAQRPRHRVGDLRARWARADRGRDSASRPETRGPALSITGASPSSFATRAPSSVADITRSFRSSRKPCCTSRASARPRSASSERSWNSSNSTAATPSSAGSSSIMRVNTPSVTTSMRVCARHLRAEAHAIADRLADRARRASPPCARRRRAPRAGAAPAR